MNISVIMTREWWSSSSLEAGVAGTCDRESVHPVITLQSTPQTDLPFEQRPTNLLFWNFGLTTFFWHVSVRKGGPASILGSHVPHRNVIASCFSNIAEIL